ncbi:MAG: hypothetical protein HW400_289 [Candidatus Levybacteria bacterium]|nr:hypothetical protein [Candidatus Levybacteria bacterium]
MHLWDYDRKELEKTESGRILMLERLINYGVYQSDKEKIKLSLVKKYWDKLNLDAPRRRLFQLLVWGK